MRFSPAPGLLRYARNDGEGVVIARRNDEAIQAQAATTVVRFSPAPGLLRSARNDGEGDVTSEEERRSNPDTGDDLEFAITEYQPISLIFYYRHNIHTLKLKDYGKIYCSIIS
jgi:hypothetical protein